MLHHILADDKKSGVDVMLSEQIQQSRRQFFAWTVIKGERDVGAIDVHRADRCFMFRDRRRFWLCWRGGGEGEGEGCWANATIAGTRKKSARNFRSMRLRSATDCLTNAAAPTSQPGCGKSDEGKPGQSAWEAEFGS